MSVNVTKANVDFNDVDELSEGIIDTRNQIIPIVDFVKSEVPGLEKPTSQILHQFLA